jgi:hypothetical protein
MKRWQNVKKTFLEIFLTLFLPKQEGSGCYAKTRGLEVPYVASVPFVALATQHTELLKLQKLLTGACETIIQPSSIIQPSFIIRPSSIICPSFIIRPSFIIQPLIHHYNHLYNHLCNHHYNHLYNHLYKK